MFHRRYSNYRPLSHNLQTVETRHFLRGCRACRNEFAKGYKSNFGFHVPFDREIQQICDQKSVFGFAERKTPLYAL